MHCKYIYFSMVGPTIKGVDLRYKKFVRYGIRSADLRQL